MHKLCWCGVRGKEGTSHYPAENPENGPAHLIEEGVQCPKCKNMVPTGIYGTHVRAHDNDPQKRTITVQIPLDVTFLADILCTAYESGGLNYWSAQSDRVLTKIGDDDMVYQSIRVTEDDENPHSKQGPAVRVIGWDEVAEGIRRVLSPAREFKVAHDIVASIFRAVMESDSGHIDAIGADVLVQVAMFNEIVYG